VPALVDVVRIVQDEETLDLRAGKVARETNACLPPKYTQPTWLLSVSRWHPYLTPIRYIPTM